MSSTNLSSLPVQDDLAAARDTLADRVRAAVREHPGAGRRIRRVAVPVASDAVALDWLRAQSAGDAVYWASRDDDRVAAGVGVADRVQEGTRPVDYHRLENRLADRFRTADSAVRYYGGLRFDVHAAPEPAGGGWEGFGAYRFVLPRFEFVTEGGGAALVCNVVLPRDHDRADVLAAAARHLVLPTAPAERALSRPRDRTDAPTRAAWMAMVRDALDAIDTGRLDKVVLARRATFALARPLDPFRVLARLRHEAPNCFHFAMQPDDGAAFMGASPERLFGRAGRTVRSEAVAGTRSRGDTPEADAALRDELLRSPKERREHAFVQNAIQANLEPLCTAVEGAKAPSELALARSRHLHAPISGTLRPGTTTVDLLRALHPTPAVGGVPPEAALREIRGQEPFDRGWYAGPVGWIGPDAAEFAVAIRSGLVHGRRLALYFAAVLGLNDLDPHRS